MRYAIYVSRNKDGKEIKLAGDSNGMSVKIMDGNTAIARITVYDGKVYDRDGVEIR